MHVATNLRISGLQRYFATFARSDDALGLGPVLLWRGTHQGYGLTGVWRAGDWGVSAEEWHRPACGQGTCRRPVTICPGRVWGFSVATLEYRPIA